MTPRIADIVTDQLSPEQRRTYDAIAASPRGKVEGPLRIWLTSPELADRAQALGAFARYGTCLPLRLSELAILVTGAYWQAGFEWHVHAPIAREAGITTEAIAAIRHGERPKFTDEDQAAVYDFARELLQTRAVGDETYARAQRLFGDRGVVDLVGVLGYYGLISMTIKAFRVPVPDASEPFAENCV